MILTSQPMRSGRNERVDEAAGHASTTKMLQVAIMLGYLLGVMRDAVKMKHKLAGGGVNLQQETQFICACWTYGILALQQKMSLKQPLRKVTYGITCVPPPVTRWTYIAATQTKSGHGWPCHALFFLRRIQHGLMKTHSLISPLRTETESVEEYYRVHDILYD